MSKIKQNDDQSLTDIDIFIDEKPTGEISAGAGYGTDGTTFQIGIKENNFNGKGINLAANLELGEDSVKGLLAYTHPNFAYSDRSVTTSIEATETDKLKNLVIKIQLMLLHFQLDMSNTMIYFSLLVLQYQVSL